MERHRGEAQVGEQLVDVADRRVEQAVAVAKYMMYLCTIRIIYVYAIWLVLGCKAAW
jgi:hypothetical protein